jgi:hypothetical protein
VAARDVEPSLEHYAEADRLFAEADGPDAALALGARSSTAMALLRLHRVKEADDIFATLQSVPFKGSSKAMYESRLALLRSAQGRHAEALALAVPATEVLGKLASKTLRAQAFWRLGSVMLAAGQASAAVAPLENAVALYREGQLQASPDRLEAEADLMRAKLGVQKK